MINNDEFMFEWESAHKRGMIAYVVPFIRSLIIELIIANVFLMVTIPHNSDNLYIVIELNVVIVLVATIDKVLSWNKREKRYAEIIQTSKANKTN